MEIISLLIGIVAGMVIGMLILGIFLKNKTEQAVKNARIETQGEAVKLEERLKARDEELSHIQKQLMTFQEELKQKEGALSQTIADKKGLESFIEEKNKSLETKDNLLEKQNEEMRALSSQNVRNREQISELTTKLENEQANAEEKLTMLNEAKEQMKTEFQNIANVIFEDKSKKFTDHNKSSIETILRPLREKMGEFEKKVAETYDKDLKERISLQKEIENLMTLNQQISDDAVNLTNALKGQTKTQGIWGEMVLEKALEISGLQKGREYDVQGGYRSEEGKLYKPDVIVHLPEGKDVVIDSKMSLNAYERFYSSDDDDERGQHLKSHVTAIHNHINGLSGKNYDELEGVSSLNYVLMFIPIEPAFILAIENDQNLFRFAFDKNIILVSPSTLLATLRTIQNLWQYEYQNRNAQAIAENAGRLYDKFVMFIEEFEKIGSKIKQSHDSYDAAFKHLVSGKGNLVKRAEDLKELGIKNKKFLSEKLIEQADNEIPVIEIK